MGFEYLAIVGILGWVGWKLVQGLMQSDCDKFWAEEKVKANLEKIENLENDKSSMAYDIGFYLGRLHPNKQKTLNPKALIEENSKIIRGDSKLLERAVYGFGLAHKCPKARSIAEAKDMFLKEGEKKYKKEP